MSTRAIVLTNPAPTATQVSFLTPENAQFLQSKLKCMLEAATGKKVSVEMDAQFYERMQQVVNDTNGTIPGKTGLALLNKAFLTEHYQDLYLGLRQAALRNKWFIQSQRPKVFEMPHAMYTRGVDVTISPMELTFNNSWAKKMDSVYKQDVYGGGFC